MKYLLFDYHNKCPVNLYFLLILAHFGLKTASFLNTHKNYRCNVETWWNDSPIHAQSEKLIFIEVGGANCFGGTGEKIGLKLKMLQILGYSGTFSISSLEYQNLSSYIFLAYIHPFLQ